MSKLLTGRVENAGEKDSHRAVTLDVDGIRFGVFDGYKKAEDGSLRLATAEWLEGIEVEILLMATMEVTITPPEAYSDSIEPSEEDPTSWQGHSFIGRVESVHGTAPPLLSDASLLDGSDKGGPGEKVDSSSFEDTDLAVMSVGDGVIIVDLSDADQEVSIGESMKVTASRTDVMGYGRH